jgi:hypothetical protein
MNDELNHPATRSRIAADAPVTSRSARRVVERTVARIDARR